jgi:hypothetical protein
MTLPRRVVESVGRVRALAAERPLGDVLSGLIFVAFGLAFAIGAVSYDLGTLLQMGPGFFPFVLGLVLAGLGVLIAAKGFVAAEEVEIGSVPWRAAALLVAAILFFGLTVRGLGIVPAVFVTALLATFAARGMRLVLAVGIAAGLTTVCVLIFVVALSLRLQLVGPWLTF